MERHELLTNNSLQRYLQLAEYARQSPDLLQNHFESKIPQRLTSHLAALLELRTEIMAVDNPDDTADYVSSIEEEIDQVKRALTTYVPEAVGLINHNPPPCR